MSHFVLTDKMWSSSDNNDETIILYFNTSSPEKKIDSAESREKGLQGGAIIRAYRRLRDHFQRIRFLNP